MKKSVGFCLVILTLAASAGAASSIEVVLPDQATTGVPVNFTVTARNGAAVDAAYAGTVHFTSSDPAATLPADYTFTPADAGSRTFSATFTRGGMFTPSENHSITVTDTANASLTGTDVTPVFWATDVVRRIVPRVESETVERGVPFDVVVSAWNAYGDVVPTYTGTIRFRGTPGLVLPADYTFTPADAGVHTFQVTAHRGGNHVVTTEDVAQPVTGASDSFGVVCSDLVVTAGNEGPSCPREGTILFANANQNDVTYEWSGPRTWFSNQQNPTAPGPGTYFVTVRTAAGCSAFASTTVGQKSVQNPSVSLSATRICGPGTVTATIANAASFADIVWTVHDGTIASGQGTATIEVQPNPGVPRLSIFVNGTYTPTGCNASTGHHMVDVFPALSAEISATGNVCSSDPRSASVPDAGANAQYHWIVTNANVTNGGEHTRSITYVPLATGDVTLSVTVRRNLDGCEATDSTVIPGGGPRALLDTNTTICPGESATVPVELIGTPPFSITWSDGVVQSGIPTNTASRTVSPERFAELTISSVNDAHCSGTGSGSARVFVEPEPEIVQQPRNVTVARGSPTTLTVSATGAAMYDWYQGESGDRSQLVASGPSPSFTTPPLTATTSYWVNVRSACASVESSTATVRLNVKSKRRAVRR